jgi:hypothetical protein
MQRREFLTASSVALLGLAVQGEMPVSAAAADGQFHRARANMVGEHRP